MGGETPADMGIGGNEPMQDQGQSMDMPTMQNGEENGQEPQMGPSEPAEKEVDGDDSTMGIINKLSDEDREAVRAYAASMLEKQKKEDAGEQQQPMHEGVKFTKGQIKNISSKLN